ncbi:hypothetical protein BS50DRAFT_678560 [Corynespora cassiicola Philippines]|uniref:Uncharacterized protein n=1 Tax=Corynespora cassiicola Philippines TaxID=1448308 RepID=A0A2T2NGA1_CORCC|nr:hypothetical protein BS50DRAFT_678560 [Corynespora cassiicola Philippines]
MTLREHYIVRFYLPLGRDKIYPEYAEIKESELQEGGVLHCLVGQDGIVTPQDMPAFNEMVNKISMLCEMVKVNYRALNYIVTRHEELIQKRWRNKTTRGRREFILKHWPEFPRFHRAEERLIEDSYKGSMFNRYLLPYMNVEDLEIADSFLTLLKSRGRNDPGLFSMTECVFSFLDYAQPIGILDRYGARIVLDETTSANGYGFVRFLDDHNDTLGHRFDFSPKRGICILIIQIKLLEILVEFSEGLLHDIPDEKLASAQPKPEPVDSELFLEGVVKSFSDRARILPYEFHVSQGLTRLAKYVSAMLNNAKDHLWALREDPGYFHDSLMEQLEHRWGSTFNKYPYMPITGDLARLGMRLSDMVLEAHYIMILWQELYSLTQRLHESQQQQNKESGQETWVQLIVYLRYSLSVLAHYSTESYAGAPKLRNNFEGRKPNDPIPHRPILSGNNVALDELLIHLINLQTSHKHPYDPGNVSFFTLDYIDTILRSNPDIHDRVTPRISSFLCQSSVVAEFLQHCDLMRIPALLDAHSTLRDPTVVKEQFQSMEKQWNCWKLFVTKSIRNKKMYTLGDPRDGKFQYPVQSVRNQDVVDTLRRAESKLDKFWNHIDTCLSKNLAEHPYMPQHEVMRDFLQNGGEMRRTPPWVEPTRGVTTKSPFLHEPYSKIFHDTSKDITGSFDKMSVQEKNKKKTRGTAAPVSTRIQELGGPDFPDGKNKFKLKSRELKVFRALFRLPSTKDQAPRGIAWHEFTRAMSAIGFRVSNLQGSAWAFSPSKDMVATHSVQFHKPHPGNEIPYYKAMRYGRRLNRLYGWDVDTFALA